jgi:hypothetical protein
MAEIKAATNEKVFPIKAFLGLNQNPDGDTKLKMGEAAAMSNFRITRDKNLQRRPGTKTILDLETEQPIKGLWVGYVNGTEYMLGACNGKLYKFWDDTTGFDEVEEIGTIHTDKDVHIFGFSNIAYILDGTQYWQWDGDELEEVHGYRPLVQTNVPPVNGTDESASLENVNRLCGERRLWISPDGTGSTFALPEKNIESVDYVLFFGDGENLTPGEDYTADLVNGTVTFTQVPAQMVNAYEIGYSVENMMRSDVENMQYAELFAGTQDTRIFLYGDGTNKTIYSGMDYYGNPRADYFPDLFEALVGDENTPITGMIRHYSSLACYKKDSAWSISSSSLTLAEGLNIPAFYVTPVNKTIGCAAPGQVRLVLNSPYTLFGNDIYEWKNSSYYTSNLTRDERQAKRISDRVWAALQGYDTEHCYCYDDNDAQEYYVCYNGDALVYNYAADAWSHYTEFPVACMANIGEELYIGTPDGKIRHFSGDYMDDDGIAISAYWESGSMSFNQDYMRKYSAMAWVGVKPESSTELYISAKTDKKTCDTKVIRTKAYSFDFTQFAFDTLQFDDHYDPQMYREKIKAKKFVFYKLTFSCISAGTRCTVLAADIRVRFTGFAK